MRKLLLLLLLLVVYVSWAQVTTSPSVTGVAASQSSVTITGGTITGLSTPIPVASGGTGTSTSTGSGSVVLATSPTLVTPNIGAATGLSLSASSSYQVNGSLLFSATAPTISSGFGGSPTIASNNGSATFRVNIGTGGVSASGIVTLPTAANGWNCSVQEFAPSAAALLSVTVVNASTTSTVSVVNDLLSTGAPTAWQASQILIFNCSAY